MEEGHPVAQDPIPRSNSLWQVTLKASGRTLGISRAWGLEGRITCWPPSESEIKVQKHFTVSKQLSKRLTPADVPSTNVVRSA